ncbi:unnamed protein product [Caenorhabditis sp. 36 PRJEB53466]|nr:unnamed protein product [Caenorhabditis sp. 36 PRJEB53466]
MKVLLLLIMSLSALVYTYPYKRSSGFERLRDRIHRKRHRHQKSSVLNETDELFEMSLLSAIDNAKENENDDVASRIRSEKSIPTTAATVSHHRHHHHHHKKNRREKNEDLCQSQRKTVELNTQSHEFDPPFVVEVRCLNTPTTALGGIFSSGGQEQTCFKGMLRCVQQYADVHVTRRGVGSMHWHPYTVPDVPVSCQCMWPVDRYGHQEF